MDRFLKNIGQDAKSFARIFDLIKDLVFIMEVSDQSFRYLYMNKSAYEVMDLKQDIIGKEMQYVLPKEMSTFLISKYKEVVTTGKSLEFESNLFPSNREFIGETSLNPILNNEGDCQYILAIVRDVTERERHRIELANMAFYDYLTGLPNRRTFEDRLTKAINQAARTNKKIAVMMLDGYNIKKINDKYGHDAGDMAIKEMAFRIKGCVRQNDTVARFGGDEMGIIIANIDSNEMAEVIANRVLESFEAPFYINEHELQLGVGIGVSFYPDHAIDKSLLVKYADKALYDAKKKGKLEYRIFKNKE
ncbi:GGDEF domain-containing protein [Schinkia azotoformans]|uniref:GGDEF domain-containing protein n=1 Tax=Schinkia azotoformans TaxID=1454 RepID=UPI002DB97273|nr:GGDEF domain-containing protein [Schinkia azotoformans]MEC1695051.1 GGDEF domain-containing protein [Schinkia azotoformans]MEC1716341.1 GGDEF domain-containing protein [Schinkia azotoformans]MEC1726856.1 GGDEF domain-containing protein [Schinkia azotoformans]MEC1746361.1 GGDEF domain-containing protein [Schinkia azotoformans]MEC1781889.1 GGDEF domain-containing protein [Schinkia azotoformans]